MGRYIGIQSDQLIRLKNINHIATTTPTKAIEEAIHFCIENNLPVCELDYNGIVLNIKPTSDLRIKLNEFFILSKNQNQNQACK